MRNDGIGVEGYHKQKQVVQIGGRYRDWSPIRIFKDPLPIKPASGVPSGAFKSARAVCGVNTLTIAKNTMAKSATLL